MQNEFGLEIYKEVIFDKECWSIYWDVDASPCGTFYQHGFKTFYDAEVFARNMLLKSTASTDEYFDENGNEVYLKSQARYSLEKPSYEDWEHYKREIREYEASTKKWKKWYMRLIKVFYKPYIHTPDRPQYHVYDLERHLNIWLGADPRDAVKYIKQRKHSESVYYYGTHMEYKSKE